MKSVVAVDRKRCSKFDLQELGVWEQGKRLKLHSFLHRASGTIIIAYKCRLYCKGSQTSAHGHKNPSKPSKMLARPSGLYALILKNACTDGLRCLQKERTGQKATEAVRVELYGMNPPIEKMDATLGMLANCE